MTAPDRIWASPDSDDGWRWPHASNYPMQGYSDKVEYTRSDLITNAAYVAGLEAALRFYADFHEDVNDGPWGLNSNDFGTIARTALSARHDAPDTRVVTVDQLNEWVVAIQAGLFWRYADKIRAIIGEVK